MYSKLEQTSVRFFSFGCLLASNNCIKRKKKYVRVKLTPDAFELLVLGNKEVTSFHRVSWFIELIRNVEPRTFSPGEKLSSSALLTPLSSLIVDLSPDRGLNSSLHPSERIMSCLPFKLNKDFCISIAIWPGSLERTRLDFFKFHNCILLLFGFCLHFHSAWVERTVCVQDNVCL